MLKITTIPLVSSANLHFLYLNKAHRVVRQTEVCKISSYIPLTHLSIIRTFSIRYTTMFLSFLGSANIMNSPSRVWLAELPKERNYFLCFVSQTVFCAKIMSYAWQSPFMAQKEIAASWRMRREMEEQRGRDSVLPGSSKGFISYLLERVELNTVSVSSWPCIPHRLAAILGASGIAKNTLPDCHIEIRLTKATFTVPL